MLYWKGRRVDYTFAGSGEIMELRWDEAEILEILENGKESRSRKEGIFEIELQKGAKTRKIVVAKSHQYFSKEHIWLIIHAGKYSRR
ncbi:hypothetical protein HY989_00180 [Candidatus Micrarchaeota archaeon]|nr:hypothetical protein [Candidatus Micrarchaeota archaeon]